MSDALIRSLTEKKGEKIVLLVLDGLGGLPDKMTGKTELEAAQSPNLDRLAAKGATGLIDTVGQGITPGSGPGHLGLFGYDPIATDVGRGVLAALGIGFDLEETDVAVRINFATHDGSGNVTDRRAGRIPHEECERLVGILQAIELPGADVFVRPVKEHRATVIFRAADLGDQVNDTDPQATGVPPLKAEGRDEPSKRTADLANLFVEKAKELIGGEERANGILLRGFARYRPLPTFEERFGMRALAIALYPMYRGVARLTGMEVQDVRGKNSSIFEAVTAHYNDYDYFFLHIKDPDKAGEDGDYKAKQTAIEKADRLVPRLNDLPDKVTIVTGDHSTPSQMKGHSWHPVPILINGRFVRPDNTRQFGETACAGGGLGRFPATQIMPIALGHAGRLRKFGA